MKDIVCLYVAVAAVFVTNVCAGADRYVVPPQSLPAGAIDQTIEVRFDHDSPVIAYSFAATYDNSVLAVNGVSTTGTMAETAFVVENINTGAGTVGFAVVLMLDLSGVFVDREIPAGQDQTMAFLDVDVLATTDVVTPITFTDVVLNPSVPDLNVNVMTISVGVSITPTLVGGDITIQNRTPRILSLAGNSGLSGQVFQVVGKFFDEPELNVMVCGSSTSAVLRMDGETLDVTAPSCGQPVGPAELKVCTDRGCDTVSDGFNYKKPPAPPTISGFQDNSGQEGTTFVILGTDFDVAHLSVFVCNQLARIDSVSPDGTSIVAIAPNCDALGPAKLEVCTELACVSDPMGFVYEFAGPRFVRGDCNGDSAVNGITDTIFMLRFLLGGDQAWPCFAACDFNDDLGFDVSDAVSLVYAAFAGGAPLPPPTTCGPGAEGSFLFGCETPQC